MTGPALLSVQDLRSYLATSQGVVRAVDGVSLTVHEAEIVGIVGESGCGKTVTCRTIIGLMPAKSLHASGEVIYHPPGGAGQGRRAAEPRRHPGPGAADAGLSVPVQRRDAAARPDRHRPGVL